MLSGAWTSRSEVHAESKHPYALPFGKDASGSSPRAAGFDVELPLVVRTVQPALLPRVPHSCASFAQEWDSTTAGAPLIALCDEWDSTTVSRLGFFPPLNPVMLSGAWTSRSEVPAESKHPYALPFGKDASGSSPRAAGFAVSCH